MGCEIQPYPLFPSTVRFWCLAWLYPRPRLTYRLPRCCACCSATAAHRLHDEGLEDIRRGRTTVTTKDTQSARLPLLPRTWGCPRKKCVRSPVDSSSFGSSAALPFTDKISSTRGLAKGQIDQDRKDGCTIQKAQGPISTAGTAPHNVGARGRGNYGSSASRGLGVVVEIFPFCECLNLCRFLRYTMLRRLAASGTAIPARSLPIACTRRCVLESSCWIRLYRLSLVLRL